MFDVVRAVPSPNDDDEMVERKIGEQKIFSIIKHVMLCVFFCYFHACFEFRKKVCLRREKKKRKKNKVLLTCCFCSHARFDDLSAAFIQIIAALLVAVLSAKSHIVGKDTPNNTGYWHTWCRRHAERFMNIVAFSIRYVCLFVWSERNLIVSLYIILLERDDCQFRVVKMKRNHLNNARAAPSKRAAAATVECVQSVRLIW